MGQLIKLQDYISRYETDIFHYPGQFIRLKKDHYQMLKDQWNEQLTEEPADAEPIKEEKKSFLKKWWPKNKELDEPKEETVKLQLPDTEEELKHWFLNQMFDFQLRWASATLQEVSYPDKKYESDQTLTYFLQRFPDSYLLMYEPIFKIKNATIDGGILLITPLEILCIQLLDTQEPSTVYETLDEKRWTKKTDNDSTTILNPMIGLNRAEKMVKSMLDYEGVKFPVKKTLIAEHGTIHSFSQIHMNAEFVDKHVYENWFNKHRSGVTPIKFNQLKAAEALLFHTQTTSFHRPEWEENEDELNENEDF